MTDVEGSTALWEAEPEAMSAALKIHDELIGDVIDRNGGVLIKSKGEGDATFSVFDEAERAILAAEAIQNTLSRQMWPTTRPIRVRISVHSGPAECRGGDYFGQTVNRCARLRAIAHGGQIVVSQSAKTQSMSERDYKDHGLHRLKDLLEPEHVFEVRAQDAFPPLKSLSSFDHNLPIQLTSFIGRERESKEVFECLLEHRLVTLIGMGGTGKTRLALQVAAEIAMQGECSVRYVSFSELKARTSVNMTVARTILSVEKQKCTDLVEIAGAMSDQRWILVFDNCEHVIESAAEAAGQILAQCPNVRILATSREPLNISGEREVPLEPLPLPPADESHPIRLRGYDSINLFLERVRLRQPDFALDAASASGVSTLVRALDGIPLAIEHVAPRVGTVGLDEIVKRLAHRLDLLKSSDRFISPRQKTIRATLEWSHELLSHEEKEAFAALSCFQGVFIMEDAQSVCGRNVFDEIESLTNKSLIVPVPLSSSTRGYRMLETVKEYARERIPKDHPEAYKRHAEWAFDLAEKLDRQLDDIKSPEAFHTLDRTYEDLTSAVLRSIHDNDPRALGFCFLIRKPWLRRGPLADGVSLLELALENTTSDDMVLLTDVRNTLGVFHMSLGHNEVAVSYLGAAAASFEQMDMPTKAAASLANMGILHAMDGDFLTAAPLFMKSRDAYVAGNDEVGAAKVALNFGRMLVDAGEFHAAQEHLSAALRVFENHDPVREAITLLNLTLTLGREDSHERIEMLHKAMNILKDSNDQFNINVGFVQIAELCAHAGRVREAEVLLISAEVCYEAGSAKASRATEVLHGRLHAKIDGLLTEDERASARAEARAMDAAGRTLFALHEINFLRISSL